MNEYVARDSVLTVLDWDCASRDALNAIKAIPAADVIPVVHGRWKDAVQSCHDSPHVKCSVCGEYYWRYFNKFNFCPSCGAKMDDNVIQHTECVGNALGALEEVEELSRYIDANKMADELSKVPWYERKDEKQAVRMVKEFPTADVVEVVRCYECKYDERCMFQSFVRDERVEPYDKTVFYCADGKRKDGGQDDV